MPRILVTNDDGFRSDGITALADALKTIGDVTIVAPVEEASAIGKLLQTEAPNGALRSSLDAGEESVRDAQAELHAIPSNPFTDSLFQLGDALREMLDQFRV